MEIAITNRKGAKIPKEFIGLFIEDINYSVDGGLNAQQLENPNFEAMDMYGNKNMDYYGVEDGLYGWKSFPGHDSAKLLIVKGSPICENNTHYLRVTTMLENMGFSNKAYEGIYMIPKKSYAVSFYARAVEYSGSIRVGIVSDGKVKVSQELTIREQDQHGWKKWEKYELTINVEEEIRGGEFILTLEQPGTMEFDFFSMKPEDAVCGVFRRDLVERLKAIKPGFLRFPGGCIVEGNTLANRYQFKKTLGPWESRTFNWNRWAVHENSERNGYHSEYSHYGQTYQIGFYEYFCLCEYLDAKPLPVLGVGIACQYQSHEKFALDSKEMGEVIQDYLDLIEFANGSEDTVWGWVRVQMGHPQPFNLTMIGIGNEQWENEESEFFARYTMIADKIHEVYPEMKLIGTSGPELGSERHKAAWNFIHENEDREGFMYAVDEHYYISPEWFVDHTDYYDKMPRKTKIFFGEYAAHPIAGAPMNCPEGNNLYGALSEAAFLTGALRNSDLVAMTCYAPLLARINYAVWNPDLIWFDDKESYGTPSYYVQQLYGNHLGDYNVVYSHSEEEFPVQVSYDETRKEIILRMVNLTDKEKNMDVVLDEAWDISESELRINEIGNEELAAYNQIGKELIVPKETRTVLEQKNHRISLHAKPYSFVTYEWKAACHWSNDTL